MPPSSKPMDAESEKVVMAQSCQTVVEHRSGTVHKRTLRGCAGNARFRSNTPKLAQSNQHAGMLHGQQQDSAYSVSMQSRETLDWRISTLVATALSVLWRCPAKGRWLYIGAVEAAETTCPASSRTRLRTYHRNEYRYN
jgi:hypothetical protein